MSDERWPARETTITAPTPPTDWLEHAAEVRPGAPFHGVLRDLREHRAGDDRRWLSATFAHGVFSSLLHVGPDAYDVLGEHLAVDTEVWLTLVDASVVQSIETPAVSWQAGGDTTDVPSMLFVGLRR